MAEISTYHPYIRIWIIDLQHQSRHEYHTTADNVQLTQHNIQDTAKESKVQTVCFCKHTTQSYALSIQEQTNSSDD